MGGILGQASALLKKSGYFVMQYGYTAVQWTLKLVNVQLQKMKRACAQKKMEKAYSGLGAEIYSLYKQGDTSDWKNMPAVQQELKIIEGTESGVFQVDESIESIRNNYLSKKAEIKENYSAKRAAIGSEQPEEVE